MEEFEETLKALDRMTRLARNGSKGATMLEDKLRAQGVVRVLEDARRKILLEYHAYEDCTQWAMNYRPCEECGQ